MQQKHEAFGKKINFREAKDNSGASLHVPLINFPKRRILDSFDGRYCDPGQRALKVSLDFCVFAGGWKEIDQLQRGKKGYKHGSQKWEGNLIYPAKFKMKVICSDNQAKPSHRIVGRSLIREDERRKT